jgi:tRNA-dihydrouridine synthase B
MAFGTPKDWCYTISMSYWHECVRIGNKHYPRFIGGPLDGYTDSPFRRVVRLFSQDNLLYTPIRHVTTIAHATGGKKALIIDRCESPLLFQITAHSTQHVETAVLRIQEIGVDGIDLNIACPAKNVVKSCAGSALMARTDTLEQVLRLLRSIVTGVLTVKMRAGFKSKNAQDIAILAEHCGVDALAIHPRLQTQRFSGALDYSIVRDIKKIVSIPVLYSGGITTYVDAQQVYEQTGVDGFLIGRALCGTPWKLAELEQYARGNTFIITPEQRFDAAAHHLAYLLELYGPRGVYHFRKHLSGYVAGFDGAAALRKKLMRVATAPEVLNELQEFFGVCGGKKTKK